MIKPIQIILTMEINEIFNAILTPKNDYIKIVVIRAILNVRAIEYQIMSSFSHLLQNIIYIPIKYHNHYIYLS